MSAVGEFFVGRNRTLTVRFLGVAIALLVVYNGGSVAFEALGISVSNELGIRLVVGGTLLGAAVNSYYNSGLLVSWTVAGLWLLPLSLGFALSDSPIGGPRTFVSRVSVVLSTMVLYGMLVGTVGFLLGVSGRRFQKWLTAHENDTRRW